MAFIRRESDIRRHLKTSEPSLLVLQEDDLSLDRYYRTQPHWFFVEDGKPPFQTIVLKAGSVPRLSVDVEALKSYGIIFMSEVTSYNAFLKIGYRVDADSERKCNPGWNRKKEGHHCFLFAGRFGSARKHRDHKIECFMDVTR